MCYGVRVYTHVGTQVRVCVYIYNMCVYINMYLYVYVCLYVYIYIYIYMCRMYICMYAFMGLCVCGKERSGVERSGVECVNERKSVCRCENSYTPIPYLKHTYAYRCVYICR